MKTKYFINFLHQLNQYDPALIESVEQGYKALYESHLPISKDPRDPDNDNPISDEVVDAYFGELIGYICDWDGDIYEIHKKGIGLAGKIEYVEDQPWDRYGSNSYLTNIDYAEPEVKDGKTYCCGYPVFKTKKEAEQYWNTIENQNSDNFEVIDLPKKFPIRENRT